MTKTTPVHIQSIYHPDGSADHYHTFPTGKLNIKAHCKYCYTTHRDWWQMKPKDYGREGVILCGKCEHTSLREFAKTGSGE